MNESIINYMNKCRLCLKTNSPAIEIDPILIEQIENIAGLNFVSIFLKYFSIDINNFFILVQFI